MNLVTHFKQNNVLETDIGDFTFASSVDQGGNAHVLKFTRDKQSFAIKFIPHGDKDKLQRFRDEFFCAAQIPTHINVVRPEARRHPSSRAARDRPSPNTPPGVRAPRWPAA
ncbi:hypothetical protein ACWD8L_41950, partial [Streptomyces sp. NPDC005133]